jgi:hypothetical protein
MLAYTGQRRAQLMQIVIAYNRNELQQIEGSNSLTTMTAYVENTPLADYKFGDDTKFAYLVVHEKPWGMKCNQKWVVDCPCHLYLYSGKFKEEDLAGLVVPMGRSGLVNLPEGCSDFCYACHVQVLCMTCIYLHYYRCEPAS